MDNTDNHFGRIDAPATSIAFSPQQILDLRNKLEVEGIDNDLLQAIETDSIKLLKTLAYDSILVSEAIENRLTHLIELFNILGEVYISRGKISEKPESYTEAAIFYQYVLSIAQDELGKGNQPNDIKEIYQNHINSTNERLHLIRTELISLVGGNMSKVRYNDITTEVECDKLYLQKLRDHTKINLDEIDKYLSQAEDSSKMPDTARDKVFIDRSRDLYSDITHSMTQFLADIVKECEVIIGIPPCKYTVIGLGSMAIGQITPYSDLEFAILTENANYRNSDDNKVRDYFKNLTHLIHLRVINLGETDLPFSKYNVELSHLIKTGVNFDLGGKTPLGREDKLYSLVQTPEEMSKYLKDQYVHVDKTLPNIMSVSVYVYGDEELIKQYHHLVDDYMHKSASETEKEDIQKKLTEEQLSMPNYARKALKRLVEGGAEFDYLGTGKDGKMLGNLSAYSPKLVGHVNEGKIFDVKKEIYRLPDRLLYDLVSFYGVSCTNLWNMLDQLHDKHIISLEATNNLQYAISFATNLRLKTYSYYKAQKDDLGVLPLASGDKLDGKVFNLPSQDLQENGALFRYYYSVLPLHKKIKAFCESDDLKTKGMHFFSDTNFYENNHLTNGMIYHKLLQYQNAIKHYEIAVTENYLYDDKVLLLSQLGTILNDRGEYDKSLEFCIQNHDLRRKQLNKEFSFSNIFGISEAMNGLAIVYGNKREYEASLKWHEYALHNRMMFKSQCKVSISESHSNMGEIYKKQGKYNEALSSYNQALEFIEGEYANADNYHLGAYNLNLAELYRLMNNLDLALTCAIKGLKIFKIVYRNEMHPNIAVALLDIAKIYNALSNYGESLSYCNQANNHFQSLYQNKLHPDIAIVKNTEGNILYNMKQHNNALKAYKEAVNIVKSLYPKDYENANGIELYFRNIIKTLLLLEQYSEARYYYNKLISVQKSQKMYDDRQFIEDFCVFADLHYLLGDIDKTVVYYQAILTRIAQMDSKSDGLIECFFRVCRAMGNIYGKMQNFDEALICYHKIIDAAEISIPNDDVIKAFNNAVYIYSEQKQYKKAIDYGLRFFDIVKAAFPMTLSQSLIYNQLLYNTACCYHFLKDDINAFSYIKNVYYVIKNNKNSYAEQLDSVQRNIVLFLADQNNDLFSNYTVIHRIISICWHYNLDFFAPSDLQRIYYSAYYEGELELSFIVNEVILALDKHLNILNDIPTKMAQSIYHNAACIFNIMMHQSIRDNENDKAEKYKQKAELLFQEALNYTKHLCNIDEGIYAEYANFLIGQKKFRIVFEYLQKGIESGDKESGLVYSKIEQEVIAPPLKKAIECSDKKEVTVNAKEYAYYLLIANYEQFVSDGVCAIETKQSYLEQFAKFCNRGDNDSYVSYLLLSDTYKICNNQELSSIYAKFTEHLKNILQVESEMTVSKEKFYTDIQKQIGQELAGVSEFNE